MKRNSPLYLLLSAFLFFACTKKVSAPTNDFLIAATPDHAFTQLVRAATSLGLEIDRSEPSTLTFTTKPKEIPTAQLLNSATFGDDDPTRFVRGRYSYSVKVSDQGGEAKAIINVMIDAFFSGKQKGLEGSGNTQWEAGKSNGKLEQALFDQVTKNG